MNVNELTERLKLLGILSNRQATATEVSTTYCVKYSHINFLIRQHFGIR